MDFIHIKDVLEGKHIGKEVLLRGWIYRKREQKDIVFLMLRDSTGVIQLTCKGIKEASQATIESSVEASGLVKEDKRAPEGFEIEVKDLKIIGLAERFPIGKDLSEEFLRDVRHLWLRSQKLTKILKIRSEVIYAIHEFFRKEGYIQFQSPSIISAACEGGSTLFEVKYFGKKAFLTQSWQLYAEAGIQALEKIYTIAPSFRAEKSRTVRHLAEYWHAEAEAAWMDMEGCMKLAEDLICFVSKKIAERCKDELKFFGRDPKDLLIEPHLEKKTYDEVIEILKKKGFDIKWGDDLGADEEKAIAKDYKKPIIVYGYPAKCKAFYHMPDPKNPKVTRSFDVIAPDVGELVGGGQRIHDKDQLIKKIKDFGLNPKEYDWYVDLRRYGTVPHSGFGLGIERLIMWIAKIEHIMDTIPFPRTMTRVTP
jgi:asparaginyl-tRNA synthetase